MKTIDLAAREEIIPEVMDVDSRLFAHINRKYKTISESDRHLPCSSYIDLVISKDEN
jgi:hypothetical protein